MSIIVHQKTVSAILCSFLLFTAKRPDPKNTMHLMIISIQYSTIIQFIPYSLLDISDLDKGLSPHTADVPRSSSVGSDLRS